MRISVVRLGTARKAGEGLRIGTVRRPPRGVPKTEFAKRDFYDVWLPMLSPSAELVAVAQRIQETRDEKGWKAFEKKYRGEMKRPEAEHVLELLAGLSREANFAVGCYCEDERWCHRSILRKLLEEKGAETR
jgi:uncharacterized protein YeaO (DUF488 family)